MSYYDPEHDFELVQLTQEDIEDAKENGFEDYLDGAVIGDWVYDDNEMFCSYSCVRQWQATTPTDTDSHRRLTEIVYKLEQLNNQ